MLLNFRVSCQVHQNVLPIREGKQGWIHNFAPDGICCHDNGVVFADIVSFLCLFILSGRHSHPCVDLAVKVNYSISGNQVKQNYS